MKTQDLIDRNYDQIINKTVNERWYPLKGQNMSQLRQIGAYPEEVNGEECFILQLESTENGMKINLVLNRESDESGSVIDSIKSGRILNFIGEVIGGKFGNDLLFKGKGDEILKSIGRYRAFNGNQSNSSFIMGNSVIGKFFRTFSDIHNPDFIIPLNLWKYTSFRNTPEPLGIVTLRENQCLIAFTRFVENQGDYWSYLNERVNSPGDRDLMRKTAEELSGLTAKLHFSLYSLNGEEFSPELFSPSDVFSLRNSYSQYLEKVCKVCEKEGNRAEFFNKVYEKKDMLDRIGDNFMNLERGNFMKQRIHGDYHLGQILKTENGPQIIDFEGEPLRTVEEKSSKQSPLKDLAGLIRSFDYLCQRRLNGDVHESSNLAEIIISTYEQTMTLLEPEFKDKSGEFRDALTAFIIEKALYETMYEYGNRPDWIQIPLQFINTFTTKIE